MALAGYKFVVLPNVWILDTPNIGGRRAFDAKAVKILYSAFLGDLQKKYNLTEPKRLRQGMEEDILEWIRTRNDEKN